MLVFEDNDGQVKRVTHEDLKLLKLEHDTDQRTIAAQQADLEHLKQKDQANQQYLLSDQEIFFAQEKQISELQLASVDLQTDLEHYKRRHQVNQEYLQLNQERILAKEQQISEHQACIDAFKKKAQVVAAAVDDE